MRDCGTSVVTKEVAKVINKTKVSQLKKKNKQLRKQMKEWREKLDSLSPVVSKYNVLWFIREFKFEGEYDVLTITLITA